MDRSPRLSAVTIPTRRRDAAVGRLRDRPRRGAERSWGPSRIGQAPHRCCSLRDGDAPPRPSMCPAACCCMARTSPVLPAHPAPDRPAVSGRAAVSATWSVGQKPCLLASARPERSPRAPAPASRAALEGVGSRRLRGPRPRPRLSGGQARAGSRLMRMLLSEPLRAVCSTSPFPPRCRTPRPDPPPRCSERSWGGGRCRCLLGDPRRGQMRQPPGAGAAHRRGRPRLYRRSQDCLNFYRFDKISES